MTKDKEKTKRYHSITTQAATYTNVTRRCLIAGFKYQKKIPLNSLKIHSVKKSTFKTDETFPQAKNNLHSPETICSFTPWRPLLVYFLLVWPPSCSYKWFWTDREVGGVPALIFISSQPIRKQQSLPPGRYKLSPFNVITRQPDELACGHRGEQHGRQALVGGVGGVGGGRREGGFPGNWVNSRLLAAHFSHEVNGVEDVTHTPTRLTALKERGSSVMWWFLKRVFIMINLLIISLNVDHSSAL